MQGLHRAFAVFAVGFLITHVIMQIMRGRVGASDAVLPFSGSAGFAVGLGTIASDLMILVAATGAFRGRFVGMRWPWMWRMLHTLAYVSWPVSIVHGLTAGRPGAGWVTMCYVGSLVGVALAMLVRLVVTRGPKDGPAAVRPANIGRKAEQIRVDDVFDEEFWVTLRKEVRR
ncbi:hypothetical protein [Sphaerisporangium corydalis]|uniref:Ferric oxidoreductase domain-containing protein n=1 Tax=Sphaerisporangium corydalis TaxID=1441875 RepID=A0ABV9E9M8_9ACTN|nr:hypothetical protein [Sphaerisporangium corydalis]